jgi:DNA invertase Pin-like site-specific DNA recombinase
MDATTPHGKAMLHMAAVFAELERGTIRERVMAGLERAKAGRDARAAEGAEQGRERHPGPPGGRRRYPEGRQGVGVDVSTVQRIKQEVARGLPA